MAFLGGMGGIGGAGIGDGLIRIGAVTNGLRGAVRGAVNDARAELNAGAKRIEATGQNWNRAFGIVGAAAKIGLAGVGIGLLASIGAATEFEKHWAGVRKTVEGTPAELEALRHQFRELAKEIPVSVNELADIGQTAGALGIAKDSLAEFAKVTAQISFAGVGVTTEQAADAIGHLANVLHIKEPDFQRFGSALIGLGNAGASTEGQILDIASRAGAAGKLIGLSTPAILAWGSAVSSMGIESEAGGSALQFFFLQASKVVNEVTKTGIPSAKALAEAQMKIRIATEALTVAETKHGRSSTQAQKASLSLMHAQDGLNKLTGQGSNALAVMAKTAGLSADAFRKLFGQDATKALSSFLAGLGKLPVAQQQAVLATLKLNNIRVIRAILGLANNSKELNRQLTLGEKAWTDNTALAEAYGKRTDTLSAQLTLLINTIKDLFISVGDAALPVVKVLVRVFREDIPKAAAYLANLLQTIWNSSLGPAVGAMIDGFRTLAAGIAGIFDFGGDPKTKGNGLTTVITGIGNAAAQTAKVVGGLASALGELLKNPIIRGLAQLGVVLGGIALALSAGAAAAGRLSGAARGIASRLTFGRFGGAAAAPTPLDGSAKALTSSATALKEAAGALKRGALADPYHKLGHLDPTGYPQLKYIQEPGPIGHATPAFGREADVLRNEFSQMSPAEQAAMVKAAQPWPAEVKKSALSAVGSNLRSGLGKIKGALGSTLSFVNAAFWPALIADLGIEFLKAPLGSFIASNTPFKRAGEQMKNDFFGGLISLVQSWSIGTDAFVGHNATMTIGKMTFNTMSLAKIGVTSATFDKLEAPQGTIEYAQGVSATAAKLAATNFARAAGENVNDWWKRVRDALPAATQAAASQFLIQGGRGAGYVKDAAGLEALVKQATTSQLSDFQAEARKSYLLGLTDTLKGEGFTAGQIGQLSTAQLDEIAKLVQTDASGTYQSLTDLVVQGYLGAFTRKSPDQVAASAGARAARAKLATAFGKDAWVGALTSFADGTFKPTKANTAIVAKLRKLFGDDWQTVLNDAIHSLKPRRLTGGAFSEAISALKADEKLTETAMKSYITSIPADVRAGIEQSVQTAAAQHQAATGNAMSQEDIDALRKSLEDQFHTNVSAVLDKFAQDKTQIDPAIAAKLTAKFGADWEVAFRNGVVSLGNKADDKAFAKAAATAFGSSITKSGLPMWQDVLRTAGTLIFEKEGGADAAKLKADIAKAISHQIAELTPTELTPASQKKPESKADAAKDRANVQKFLASQQGLDALAAAASDDTTKAKDGFQKLGDGLKKAIPDESARNRFVGTLVALQKAATTPNLDGLTGLLGQAIPTAGRAVTTLADGVQLLTDRVAAFLHTAGLPSGGSGTKSSGTGSRSTGGKIAAATGMVFDTHGETSMTVGEAGREHVAVLRNFKTVTLPKRALFDPAMQTIARALVPAARTPALAGAAPAAAGGHHQTIYVDHMHVQSAADEQAIMDTLDFMSPGGLGR